MRVYIVRHAKAEKEHAGGDAARRLTPEGRDAFTRLVREIRQDLEVSRVVTSPFARAVETARVLAHATGAPVEEDDELASGKSDGAGLLDAARRGGAGVAVVGHNPEVQEAIARAAGRDEPVKPGTIAALELSGKDWRVLWIAAPARTG